MGEARSKALLCLQRKTIKFSDAVELSSHPKIWPVRVMDVHDDHGEGDAALQIVCLCIHIKPRKINFIGRLKGIDVQRH